MSIGICIIAHEPLASALKSCAQHIYSTTGDAACDSIACYDVPADLDVKAGIEHAEALLEGLGGCSGVIVFTDLLGATPSNIAMSFLDDPRIRVISGVNLPAVVAALSAPPDASANQVMAIAEGAAHAGISSSIGRE